MQQERDTSDPATANARSDAAAAQARVDEALVDPDQESSSSASWSQLAAGTAVLTGLAMLLLRTDAAGQVWGAVLAALGLVATIVVEWVKVARRRALQH